MIAAGVNGMQTGLNGFESTAQEVAAFNLRSGDEGKPREIRENVDIAEAMVEMKVYERQVQASAKVVQTADAAIGFLIDTV